tara:strand:- start:176 stop:463 length:288 start_codon:yes stop_codon:yes gene_type:complete
MKLIKIVPSSNKAKKYDAFFLQDSGREKKISFGSKGMDDFTKTKNEEQKKRYLDRHRKNENWNSPMTAGALSRWILWYKPSLRESIADFKKRFNL